MEHHHSLLASQPLPYLPLELDHHILRFCDPSTLAITSRVSLAFLELSSPILYQDIEIVGLNKVEKLFCSRGDDVDDGVLDLPQLHPYLNLVQVRNLTIIATAEMANGDGELDLWPSRIPADPPLFPSLAALHPPLLPVENLLLRPIGVDPGDKKSELRRWSGIHAFVNPKFAHIFGLPTSPSFIPRFDPETIVLWDRLVEVQITNAIFGHERNFFSLYLSSDMHPVVVFDLAFESSWGNGLLTGTLWELNPEAMTTKCVKGWVVRFGSESEKVQFRELLEEYWRLEGLDDAGVEEAQQRVRLEVVA